MIPGALILVIYTVASYTFGLLPTTPALGLNGFALSLAESSGLWGHLGWANDYFPLDAIVSVVTYMVYFFALFIGVRFLLWIPRATHILGGGAPD